LAENDWDVVSQPSTNNDWDVVPKAQESNEPSIAGDVAKSLGTGVTKGVIGLPGLAGDIAELGGAGIDWAAKKFMSPEQFARYQEANAGRENPLPTSADIVHGVEKVTGQFHEPETTAGRYAQTVGEFLPAVVGGPESIGTRLATRVAVPAIASETAGELAHGTSLEPAARIAGALVGRSGASMAERALAPGPNIPTLEELHDAASANYRNARNYGVEIRRPPVARLADDIYSDLSNDGFRGLNVPKTWGAIDELKNPAGKYVTIDDIESVRKALLRAGANPLEGAEREASRRAISAIDNYMSNLQPGHVAINPHYAMDVADEIKEARGNWGAYKRGELIESKGESALDQTGATGSGANINNVIRQKVKSVLNNPKQLRGFTDDEIAQMRKVVRGTSTGNVGRAVGKLAPTGIVSGALGVDLGMALAGATPFALGVPLLGKIAKTIGDASTKRQFERLARMVRARSPLGQSLPQPTAPTPVSASDYGRTGLLAGQAAEMGRASGGAVCEDTIPEQRASMEDWNPKEMERAEGGRITEKPPLKTRKKSGYSATRGKPDHHCGPDKSWPTGYCKHFIAPHKCAIVAGHIAKRGSCAWWAAAHPERAAGGRLGFDDGGDVPVVMSDESDPVLVGERYAANLPRGNAPTVLPEGGGRGRTGGYSGGPTVEAPNYGDLGDLRGEMNKLIAESKTAPPRVVEPEIIPPSSPKVQQAIDRLKAWLPINERNGPNPAIRKNIEIMERGGKMAEGMADHTLKTWSEPPQRGIPSNVIEGDLAPLQLPPKADGGRIHPETMQAPDGHHYLPDPKRASGGRVEPANINHNPTEAQAKAGNYAKDRLSFFGLELSIENAKGSIRKGKDKDGREWAVRLPYNYGHLRRQPEAADGDAVDIILGPHTKSRKVFVVDQHDAETGEYDEIKALLGYATRTQAEKAYKVGFSDGKGHKRLGHLAEMDVSHFRDWLENGDTKAPIKGTHYAPKIDLSHDVKVMSELSRDGSIFYGDRSLPRKIMNNGKQLDPIEPLIQHEKAEYIAMREAVAAFKTKNGRDPTHAERVIIYKKSHRDHGNVAEKHWIDSNGYSWGEWEAWCRGELDRLEHKKVINPPKNPDVKPAPHDRRELESTV
jgi:hypothetical protein